MRPVSETISKWDYATLITGKKQQGEARGYRPMDRENFLDRALWKWHRCAISRRACYETGRGVEKYAEELVR
jgi:hypothetical protein